MVKKAAILLSAFPTAVFPPEWQASDWGEIVRNGKGYKVIMSFDKYFTPAISSQFEFIGTIAEFDAWVAADPLAIKMRDIDFGNALLLEFLTGQKDLSLDNATYRAVTDTFRYAEAALKRGDLVQARTELTAIAPIAPLWTTDIKTYYLNKLTTYIGY